MQQRIYPQLVIDTLKQVRYPGNGQDIVTLGMVADDIRIDGVKVTFSLTFPKSTDPFMRSVVKNATETLRREIPGIEPNIAAVSATPAPAPKPPVLPGVKNIIGISSGKGGVGKSTVASNLAVALARDGYKVGLLDADIFGPSVPKMFGLEDTEIYMHEVGGRQLIIPAERHGVKLLSIGFLVDKNAPVLWRGSMASNALRQLIEEADWGQLDYFLIDMPPGTSDIHLTLVQTLAITGAVIVTTPQQVALADARKGINMFLGDKVGVPVLGLVENMAWFTPQTHPDERYWIFGREGGVKLAHELNVPLLAQIPIVGSICDSGDSGTPIATDDTITAHAFMHLAHEVVDAVERRNETMPATQRVDISRKK